MKAVHLPRLQVEVGRGCRRAWLRRHQLFKLPLHEGRMMH